MPSAPLYFNSSVLSVGPAKRGGGGGLRSTPHSHAWDFFPSKCTRACNLNHLPFGACSPPPSITHMFTSALDNTALPSLQGTEGYLLPLTQAFSKYFYFLGTEINRARLGKAWIVTLADKGSSHLIKPLRVRVRVTIHSTVL